MATYTIDQLKTSVGLQVGQSDWHTVTQEQVNMFADVTDDHQWIHIDVERAKTGPFGHTIAHGFLTIALLPMLLSECIMLEPSGLDINYGFNRVRFPAPVPVGSRIRAQATLNSVEEIEGGVQLILGFEVLVDGGTKPAVVGETIFRRYWTAKG